MVDYTKNPSQIRGLIRLTRWQEHLPFVIPLSVLGALLATRAAGTNLDWRFISVSAANSLAVAFAFMLNDIEDAPDDANDPHRAARNPLLSGQLDRANSYRAAFVVALAALPLYLPGGQSVLAIGLAVLALGYLYSRKPMRLKSWPVLDLISHSLLLGGLLIMGGHFTYSATPGSAWLIIASVSLLSAYGQLYNQLRDFRFDQMAGLRTSAIVLGQRRVHYLMVAALALAAVLLVLAILRGVFPWRLAIGLLLSIFTGRGIVATSDMRGSAVTVATGSLQIQGLAVVNMTIAFWLLVTLIARFVR